jgi:uncharacterized protein
LNALAKRRRQSRSDLVREEKYRGLPMDLADASLVRVAEREGLSRIFTVDRRHFSVYQPGRRRRFAILP